MANLQRLLAPKSIAVVGGAPAERVVQQCLKLGFEGPIWPVHPTRSTLAGVACVASLDELPGAPDAVFLGINRHSTVAAMTTLASIGAGGAVCYGSGFTEAGHSDLQTQLLEASGAMPFFGPNCYGFVNTFDKVALWPDEHGCARHERGVAIVSQSGNVAVNLTFQQRGLRLGTMISVGNQANLGTEDAIAALLDDDRITAIGLFLEAVRDPQRFAEVAVRAHGLGVAIVALQTGRSAAGAVIAASHTGSMSGRAAAYDAMFARYGVATARTPSELLETLKLLDSGGRLGGGRLGGGRLGGRRIVALSCSGGEASLVADLTQTSALKFEPFADEHRARIEATVTDLVTVSNPFDYHTFSWGDRVAMSNTFTAVMDGPQDVTLLILDAPSSPDNDPTAWYTAADALADAAASTGNRAVVVATLAECSNPAFQAHITDHGLTSLLGLSEALVALEAAGPANAVGSLHTAVCAPGDTRVLDEFAAKQRLRAMGIEVPNGRVASATEVLKAAAAIGYPVTLKALGVAHKSESGAVKVGLGDETSVRDALDAMPASEAGFLVETTVTDVVAEMLVTVRRDPPVGWLVAIGFGGVTTELWNDVVNLLAPVTPDDVREALNRLRSVALLHGFRGRPAANIASFVDLVVRLTTAVVGTDVVEVELNPVLVGQHGATAVDALMVVEADDYGG